MVKKVVEITGLKKSFGKIRAVNGLDMDVFKGDIFGLLGPNGAGKSTTIRMMLSLINPDEGSISILGESLALKRKQILSKCGSLIERADFYTYLTAYDNMRLIADITGKEINSADILELIDIVGLSARANSKVKTYSQGMKQRLGIAQALLGKPELVILDEPTNGLDPQGMKEIRDLIKRLNVEMGMTIILSSHILFEVEQLANRMVIINNGVSVVSGYVDDLLNAGELQVIFKSNDPKKLSQIASENNFKFNTEGDDIIVQMSLNQIPNFSKLLLKSDIEVFGIIPKRSLETYFLNLT